MTLTMRIAIPRLVGVAGSAPRRVRITARPVVPVSRRSKILWTGMGLPIALAASAALWVAIAVAFF